MAIARPTVRTRFRRFCQRHLFQASAGLVLLAVVLFVALTYLGAPVAFIFTVQEAGLLAIAFLGAAALAQFGGVFFLRLRKIGPIELADPEVQHALDDFRRFRYRPPDRDLSVSARHARTREGVYAFEKYSAQVLAAKELGQGAGRFGLEGWHLGELLYQLGTFAMGHKWPASVEHLELLLKITDAEYEPFATMYALGLSYVLWADATPDAAEVPKMCERELSAAQERKEDRNRRGAWWLFRATEHDGTHHLPWFWIAWAQDELGAPQECLDSLERCLRRRPAYGPAKLNRAIALIRLGRFEDAYGQLAQIREDDEQGKNTRQHAVNDPDLDALLSCPEWGAKALNLLEQFVCPTEHVWPLLPARRAETAT